MSVAAATLASSSSSSVVLNLDVNTGCFVPHNKVFTHFTADNIDINDSTLDGKIVSCHGNGGLATWNWKWFAIG
jgi:hypothetical protein